MESLPFFVRFRLQGIRGLQRSFLPGLAKSGTTREGESNRPLEPFRSRSAMGVPEGEERYRLVPARPPRHRCGGLSRQC